MSIQFPWPGYRWVAVGLTFSRGLRSSHSGPEDHFDATLKSRRIRLWPLPVLLHVVAVPKFDR